MATETDLFSLWGCFVALVPPDGHSFVTATLRRLENEDSQRGTARHLTAGKTTKLATLTAAVKTPKCV